MINITASTINQIEEADGEENPLLNISRPIYHLEMK